MEMLVSLYLFNRFGWHYSLITIVTLNWPIDIFCYYCTSLLTCEVTCMLKERKKKKEKTLIIDIYVNTLN